MSRATRAASAVILVLVASAAGAIAARAAGLSCSIGEIVLENLPSGGEFSLLEGAGIPLILTNTGDAPVRLAIVPQIPDSTELRHGAEPIPALDWAAVSPETLWLAPRQFARVELVLRLPDEAALAGRKFQVQFWSHTLPEPGEMLVLGLKSRIVFTVRSDAESAAASPPAPVPTPPLWLLGALLPR